MFTMSSSCDIGFNVSKRQDINKGKARSSNPANCFFSSVLENKFVKVYLSFVWNLKNTRKWKKKNTNENVQHV